MLTCIRKAFDLIRIHKGESCRIWPLYRTKDPRVYEMLQKADAIGVFQVESRAQMSMLPRFEARFYDLVIRESPSLRPSPIQAA